MIALRTAGRDGDDTVRRVMSMQTLDRLFPSSPARIVIEGIELAS